MGRTLTISPSGILDSDLGSALRAQVIEALEEGATLIAIKMGDVSFMDSSGFGALMMIFKKVRDANADLVLHDVNTQVRLVFELTGTDKVFPMEKSSSPIN